MKQLAARCNYFGECGGCVYQNISYAKELVAKKKWLRETLLPLKLKDKVFEPVRRSSEEYHYRNRLDISFRKTLKGEYILGFKPEGKRFTIQIDSCAIAKKDISKFIPKLRKLAIARLPEGYNIANLVVRTGDDGRVFWGGMGRRSLELAEKDYLWTEVCGRRIFYSLDTFFQANLSILPALIETIRALPLWNKKTTFLDLYSGVGLFGISLHDLVKRVVMIEESVPSLKLARFNVDYHKLTNVEIRPGKVEELLGSLAAGSVALIDPPRKGLSAPAIKALVKAKKLKALLYLSCNPEALARDLAQFKKKGWKIQKVMPFDFFPKTKHLETFVWLTPK
ncbi:MAG: class I SAM-dependent RNA methyltransferase [Candidatus Omnitrophica bacterium]|nr:class I SAM-dependent RNA methyltransferase [Candidatus Omnitrophota bacterium]